MATARGETRVGDPATRALESGVAELGTSQGRSANLAGRYTRTQAARALLEAEYMRYAQKQISGFRGRHHLFHFAGVHGHGFLAEHRLAGPQGGEHVAKMKGIGGGNENGVDLGRAGQLFGGGERMRDTMLRGRGESFFAVAAGERGDDAVPSQSEGRHQALDRMQTESGNPETNFTIIHA